ncbi:hypothetical protein A2154_00155 [Candidatus Gottesmanbacteria bacterium RBG_16_43_7]|uniref:Glycosyltransferase subfamily 4-like N-terminal domain-containing protein n=1 Tax=Candidatus Gottesmanbacteria bacterium RBG_16_43_7 TaxID=1798373 RepID=A0A1F5ZCV6_9BACT|nr:MAG: hypothetical protein A2154_00155 [Candidatus Gottesmanbacteria bacterium RBG_16_43_7]
MIIGIDISQIVYEGSGVARIVRGLTKALIRNGQHHHFVLFGSSLRQRQALRSFIISLTQKYAHVHGLILPLPPTVLHIIWNVFHIIPIEVFTGKLDVFISNDWTQPPLRSAVGITIIYDLSVFTRPQEFQNRTELVFKSASFKANIIQVQKRRLLHVLKEVSAVICDSQSAKADIHQILGISSEQIHVVYPGLT